MTLESKTKENVPELEKDERILALRKDISFWQPKANMAKLVFFAMLALFFVLIVSLLVFPLNGGFTCESSHVAIPDALYRLSQGVLLDIRELVLFDRDDVITTSDAIGKHRISIENVQFVCSDSNVCGQNGPLVVNDNIIRVRERAELVVSFCYNHFNDSDHIYRILIGSNVTKLRLAAETACGLS